MKAYIVLIPILFLGSAAFAQDKAKEDSTKYWFNKKLEVEHRRDSLKKAAIKKQPSARPKTTTKAKSQ